MQNKDKNFVQRILNPHIFPRLNNADKSVSTHSMADAEVDGRFIAYPTVVPSGDSSLTRLDGNAAIDRAIKENDFIEFASQEEATWFAKNYKNVWNSEGYKI